MVLMIAASALLVALAHRFAENHHVINWSNPMSFTCKSVNLKIDRRFLALLVKYLRVFIYSKSDDLSAVLMDIV